MKLDITLACCMISMAVIQTASDMREDNYAQTLEGLWTTEAIHIDGQLVVLEILRVITTGFAMRGLMMDIALPTHFAFKPLKLRLPQPQRPLPLKLLQLLTPPASLVVSLPGLQQIPQRASKPLYVLILVQREFVHSVTVIRKVAYAMTAAAEYSKDELAKFQNFKNSKIQNFVLNIMLRSNLDLTYSVL